MADERESRIWALLGARAGDNDQVLALAEALGIPFEIRKIEYNSLHVLGPRLLGQSLASLTGPARDEIVDDIPPDLTISSGHRSVPVVQSLRARSRGRTRSIHVGFPRISPANFELVVATPQYAIADHPNVLRIPYALTRAATDHVEHIGGAKAMGLPRPRRLLVVGGPTLYWELNKPKLLETLAGMIDEARADGGSVLVTTSPRTPRAVTDELAAILETCRAESLLAKPGSTVPYASLLRAADSFRVTADSVSMVSDAIWTGKPVALVPISMSLLGRMVFSVHDRLGAGTRTYPQDLRFFWRALREIGIGEQLALPRTTTDELLAKVTKRARTVLPAGLVY